MPEVVRAALCAARSARRHRRPPRAQAPHGGGKAHGGIRASVTQLNTLSDPRTTPALFVLKHSSRRAVAVHSRWASGHDPAGASEFGTSATTSPALPSPGFTGGSDEQATSRGSRAARRRIVFSVGIGGCMGYRSFRTGTHASSVARRPKMLVGDLAPRSLPEKKTAEGVAAVPFGVLSRPPKRSTACRRSEPPT